VQAWDSDSRYEEEVCAWIQLKPGCSASDEEIREFCRGRIAHFKIPRYIRFVAAFSNDGKGAEICVARADEDRVGFDGIADCLIGHSPNRLRCVRCTTDCSKESLMVKRREFLVGSVGLAMATPVAAASIGAVENTRAPPESKDQENSAGQPYDQVALLCLGRSALAASARGASHADV